jgi:hypothetical protein
VTVGIRLDHRAEENALSGAGLQLTGIVIGSLSVKLYPHQAAHGMSILVVDGDGKG